MKLSLFIEITIPRPWDEETEHRKFQETLEQIETADRLGFHAVWVTEHHFMEEFCHASAPEIILAAAAGRTKQIRLGHGIVSMPPGVNHPARVAERIATLDLLSSGRVEFGTGESSSVAELDGFRIDPGKKREMWHEGVKVATRCMEETPFRGFQGQYVDMPPRNVVPKPLQRPHPPIWVACTRPSTMTLAAENGLGALGFITSTDTDEVRARVEEYYRIFESEAVALAGAVNPNVLYTGGNLMCAPTMEEATRRIDYTGGFFPWAIGYYYVSGDHHPGVDNLWDEYGKVVRGEVPPTEASLAEDRGAGTRADWKRLAEESLERSIKGWPGVGTVESIRERIEEYENAGLDQLMFYLPPVKQEYILESLELVGREIIPELHERDVEHQRSKRERLAPAIEAAMSRRIDDAPPLDPDYTFGGVPVAWDRRSVASEVAEARLGLPMEDVHRKALGTS